MPIIYDDEKSYLFHDKDTPDKCFMCSKNTATLLVFRQIASMKLVHLCQDCICDNLGDYLLDNTRPWLGEKGKFG
ncbi:MAG TPA: hypothetical protein DDY17_02770 [Syntrophaceae bacterium]|jgi:hypothetical protein|nr:hypothetical protein [Syntrophaceae bacterium]